MTFQFLFCDCDVLRLCSVMNLKELSSCDYDCVFVLISVLFCKWIIHNLKRKLPEMKMMKVRETKRKF